MHAERVCKQKVKQKGLKNEHRWTFRWAASITLVQSVFGEKHSEPDANPIFISFDNKLLKSTENDNNDA